MADYSVDRVDLDQVKKGHPVIVRGISVTDLTVIDLPAGAVGHVWVRLGGVNKPQIPLLLLGQAFHIEPPEKNGIFIDTDVALPGVSLSFLSGITVEG